MKRWFRIISVGVVGAMFLPALAGCNLINVGSESLHKTETALAKQQTRLAKDVSKDLNATITAQQATIDAQAALPVEPIVPSAAPDLAATQIARSVEQTAAVQQTAAAQGGNPPPTAAPPPDTQAPPANAAPGGGDLEAQMKSASILLYEDIVNDPSVYRYVQQALDAMSLTYKDDGSAKGWMKTDLLSGGPNGKPWDLIIAAVEARGEFQGEYFEYLNDALNQGSSVIIEAWHLDAISQGKASAILTRCGVQVYPYFPKTGQPTDIIIWPTGVPSPLLSEPYGGMRFTNVLTTWLASGDLGSLMALTGSGDAQLVLSSSSSSQTRDGVLATCLGGQLTLQTFSSHSFNQNTMLLLWQNYIHNALKVHFTATP